MPLPRCHVLVEPSCPQRGRQDSHSTWINQPGSRHEHALLRALDEAADVPIADLALRAAEVFVEQHDGEITDIRRPAALEASTVSKLAFRAYASAESTGFRTRCLDVIDRLLAARIRDVEHLVKQFEVERA